MTQSNPLRVGLIGARGRWGPRAHVPALKGVSEAELYAVCTAHAATAQAAADKFGVTRAYAGCGVRCGVRLLRLDYLATPFDFARGFGVRLAYLA